MAGHGAWLAVLLLLPGFIEIPVFNANSLDPHQTPHSAVSNLWLDCLLMSYLWGARHKWVKFFQIWRLFLKERICSQREQFRNKFFLLRVATTKKGGKYFHVSYFP